MTIYVNSTATTADMKSHVIQSTEDG